MMMKEMLLTTLLGNSSTSLKSLTLHFSFVIMLVRVVYHLPTSSVPEQREKNIYRLSHKTVGR